MTRAILGFFAVLMYGSLAMAAGIAQSDSAPKQADALMVDDNSTMLGGISEEERERRVQVCEREWEFCMDWCKKSKGGGQCRQRCVDSLSDCMKNIPYAGKD